MMQFNQMRNKLLIVFSSLSSIKYASTMSTGLFSSKTLIVATSKDPASWNIANALIDSSPMWNTQKSTDSSSIYCTKTSDLPEENEVWLWMQDQQLLYMNNIDDLMKRELQSITPDMNIKFDDVIFLSRHSAASGQASLTVHPIGIYLSIYLLIHKFIYVHMDLIICMYKHVYICMYIFVNTNTFMYSHTYTYIFFYTY
jgi:hypothetical protein